MRVYLAVMLTPHTSTTPTAHTLKACMNPTAAIHDITPMLPPMSVDVPWSDLLPHRDYLVRFARRKLQDPALAEDLVHDVFEAVVTGHAVFGGRAALRSWLTAVLKNKIVDLVRQRCCTDYLAEECDDEAGMALQCPRPQPDQQAQQRQAVRQVLQGIEDLPQNLRQAMQLRVLHDQSAQEVCNTLQITENNLFQRMFRARKALSRQFAVTFH
jgi:RNA polymerase sigma-70 factor (ECF subfamily)